VGRRFHLRDDVQRRGLRGVRDRRVQPSDRGLEGRHHHDNGSQYTSFAFTSRLIEAGVDASVGSVGDGYDNALAETTIGLFKTEKIHREAPWRGLSDVELATLEWVDWYNHERLHSACGGVPPAQYETDLALQLETQ
jgi:putative transposase